LADYELLYWSAPFRGQFVRAVLAFAGKTWTEGGDAKIARLIEGPVEDLPVPFMGPPVLLDQTADVALAEMPAIILYLGETLDLMPETPALRAMTMKIVNDANDVIVAGAGVILAWQVSHALLLIFSGILISTVLDAAVRGLGRALPAPRPVLLAIVTLAIAVAWRRPSSR